MSKFSFSADKSAHYPFAKDCLDAEEFLGKSCDSCVKFIRTAVDATVNRFCATDKNFSLTSGNLFDARKVFVQGR